MGIVTGLMFVVLFVTQRKKLRLPQGPRSLPIIGNIHQLGNDAHTFLWQEAKKYGPIMYLRLGSQGLVVASSAEAAREFVKVQDKVWAGRESSTAIDMFTYNHLKLGVHHMDLIGSICARFALWSFSPPNVWNYFVRHELMNSTK